MFEQLSSIHTMQGATSFVADNMFTVDLFKLEKYSSYVSDLTIHLRWEPLKYATSQLAPLQWRNYSYLITECLLV